MTMLRWLVVVVVSYAGGTLLDGWLSLLQTSFNPPSSTDGRVKRPPHDSGQSLFLAGIVEGGQPIDQHAKPERRVSEIRIQISDGLYRGVVPHTAK